MSPDASETLILPVQLLLITVTISFYNCHTSSV